MGFHNPPRPRGIDANTGDTTKSQSLTNASGWDSHKLASSKLTASWDAFNTPAFPGILLHAWSV